MATEQNKTIKMALFRDPKNGTLYPLRVYSEREKSLHGDERISEIIDVNFPLLDQDELLKKYAASIDAQIETLKVNALEEIARLQQKKSELLAIADQSEQSK
jgi:hypothetical protein